MRNTYPSILKRGGGGRGEAGARKIKEGNHELNKTRNREIKKLRKPEIDKSRNYENKKSINHEINNS